MPVSSIVSSPVSVTVVPLGEGSADCMQSCSVNEGSSGSFGSKTTGSPVSTGDPGAKPTEAAGKFGVQRTRHMSINAVQGQHSFFRYLLHAATSF
jgi:hypothetical protein